MTEFETTFTLEAIVAASLAVTASAPPAVADWLVIDAAVRVETLFVASTAPAADDVAPKNPCCTVVDALETVALIVAVVERVDREVAGHGDGRAGDRRGRRQRPLGLPEAGAERGVDGGQREAADLPADHVDGDRGARGEGAVGE